MRERGACRGRNDTKGINEVRRTIPCLPAEDRPRLKEPLSDVSSSAGKTGRTWVRVDMPGTGPVPPLSKASGWRTRDFPLAISFPLSVAPHASPVHVLPPALPLAGFAWPACSCNRLKSEDRARPGKSLIPLRGMIRDLLQDGSDVTGCFSVVTTSATLSIAANAVHARSGARFVILCRYSDATMCGAKH